MHVKSIRRRVLRLYRTPRIQLRSLLGPATFWVGIFGLLPLLFVVFYSFLTRGEWGTLEYIFTWENYSKLVNLQYLGTILRSVWLGTVTTFICFLIGYPTAYWIALYGGKRKVLFLFLVIIPLWTSDVVRMYALMFLLKDTGLLNIILKNLHIIDSPLRLLYNVPSVLIGLVYNYLPFMILPLYAAIERLDVSLLEAAADLGAKPFQRFLKVTLPLTKGGVLSGSMLVFAPAIGTYIIPTFLGGAHVPMIGPLVARKFMIFRDWPFGSALALLVITITIGVVIAAIRSAGGEEIYEELT